jgi:hypothetical protein
MNSPPYVRWYGAVGTRVSFGKLRMFAADSALLSPNTTTGARS